MLAPDNKPQPLTPAILTKPYHSSPTRLLLFDYDGTLTPIVPHPPSALLPPLTRQHLSLLASNPKNTVWIISGRDRAFLTQHLGSVSPRLGLSAEHGAFIREPETDEWVSLVAATEDMGWRGVVRGMFEDLACEVEGSEVEEKEAAVVWHFRRAVDGAYAAGRAGGVARQLREGCVGLKWDVEVVEGKCVVEVRARRLGKGGVVERLLRGGGSRGWEFVGCWGDDRTDEGELDFMFFSWEERFAGLREKVLTLTTDMFQALAESGLADETVFSIKVGDGSTPTCAKWIVADPEEVLNCMRWLTDADDGAEHNTDKLAETTLNKLQ